MEPRLGSRGKLEVVNFRKGPTVASMEPRLGSRGKCWSACRRIGNVRLQWSRDLEVAERGSNTKRCTKQHKLQWSRDLEVAESDLPHGVAGLYGASFNGAATWKSRKGPESSQSVGEQAASMEPRLGSRGKTLFVK